MKYYRNGEVIDVTKGAYESIFKKNGWMPKEEKEAVMSEQTEGEAEDFEIDDSEEDSGVVKDLTYLFDKSVSEFTQDEARDFVERYNIKVEAKNGKAKKADIVEAIEKFIKENK